MAIELAVFRRCEVWAAGGDVLSLDELRESQENAPVSFLEGAGLLCEEAVFAELAAGAGAAVEDEVAPGLRAGEAVGGDHGMLGSALVILLSDNVLEA